MSGPTPEEAALLSDTHGKGGQRVPMLKTESETTFGSKFLKTIPPSERLVRLTVLPHATAGSLIFVQHEVDSTKIVEVPVYERPPESEIEQVRTNQGAAAAEKFAQGRKTGLTREEVQHTSKVTLSGVVTDATKLPVAFLDLPIVPDTLKIGSEAKQKEGKGNKTKEFYGSGPTIVQMSFKLDNTLGDLPWDQSMIKFDFIRLASMQGLKFRSYALESLGPVEQILLFLQHCIGDVAFTNQGAKGGVARQIALLLEMPGFMSLVCVLANFSANQTAWRKDGEVTGADVSLKFVEAPHDALVSRKTKILLKTGDAITEITASRAEEAKAAVDEETKRADRAVIEKWRQELERSRKAAEKAKREIAEFHYQEHRKAFRNNTFKR
jgi:hypothetical protein